MSIYNPGLSGGGQVDNIQAGTNINVDSSNPISPIISLELGADENFVTDAEKIVIGNTSGTNSGDQDLSGLLPNSHLTDFIHSDIAHINRANLNEINQDLGTTDTPEFADIEITTLPADSWLGNAAKSVFSYITNLKSKLLTLFSDIKDDTGFIDNDNIGVSYDSTARTVTLTHSSGTITYYWRGQVKTLESPWTSTAHTNSDGVYFLYSADGTNFTWSTTPFNYYDIQVAISEFQTGYKFGLREPHGANMRSTTHSRFHTSIGTTSSGGDLSNYTLSSTTLKYPDTSATTLVDEDNTTVNPSHTTGTGTYTNFYLSGAGATINLVTDQSAIVPVSGNQPYYNQFTGGAWQQTLLPTSNYMNLWQVAVPVTSDSGSQKYRYFWIQGQNASLNLGTIQALSSSSLNLGGLVNAFPEFSFINRVIIQYIGGNWSIVQVDKLTGNRQSQVSSPAGNYLSSVTTDATLTGNGTAGSPLGVVQNYVTLTGNQSIDGTKTFTSDVVVPDEAYDATNWNGSLEVPTKNAIRDKIESLPTGGAGDKLLQDYQGSAVIGVLGKADYTTTGTISEVTLIADSIPVGSNLIVELRKNSVSSGNILSSTLQIATSDTLTNGQKSVSTTSFSDATIADGDYFVAYLTSVGSTTSALNARLIIR